MRGFYEFKDGGRRIDIYTPDTMADWNNYLFNDDYYLEINQVGQGSSQVIKPLRRFAAGPYRYFFLKDMEHGSTWSAMVRPLPGKPDEYRCTHHLTHSEFYSKTNGIASRVRVFVPQQGCREIWTVTVINETPETRKLSLFSVMPFSDGGLMNANGWYDEKTETAFSYFFPYHTTYDQKAQVEHLNTLSYLFASRPPVSVDTNQRFFFGTNDPYRLPDAVAAGQCFGSICNSENPVGAFQHDMELAPGASDEIHFVVGFEPCEKRAAEVRQTLLENGAVEKALDEVIQHWNSICGQFIVKTPDENINLFMNWWIKKQNVFQSRLNRLCAVFPVRNPLQDFMGYSMFDPQGAFELLVEKFKQQNISGFLQQWHTEDGKNEHGLCKLNFMDGGFWLIICTLIAVNQSGEASLLDTRTGYIDSETKESLYQHMKRAMAYLTEKRGQHGFCLFGDGDWTDPVNGPGRKGRGESTWSTSALSFSAKLLIEFAEERGDTAYASELRALRNELKELINRHAWNGQWYVTGFDDDGNSFGNPEDEEGRIFINSQTWPIMADIPDKEQIKALYKAMKNMETPAGPLLVWPVFSKWNPVWGRISLKLAGTSENGSIYCHASMFKAYADCVAGNADEALKTVVQTLPTNPDNPPEKNTQIPTFVPNYYFSLMDSPSFGQSSRHHRTGTSPWLQWVVLENMLGVRATIHGLKIEPCMPSKWNRAFVERRFKNAVYRITLTRGTIPSIAVNGTVIGSSVLPHMDGAEYNVEVIYN